MKNDEIRLGGLPIEVHPYSRIDPPVKRRPRARKLETFVINGLGGWNKV